MFSARKGHHCIGTTWAVASPDAEAEVIGVVTVALPLPPFPLVPSGVPTVLDALVPLSPTLTTATAFASASALAAAVSPTALADASALDPTFTVLTTRPSSMTFTTALALAEASAVAVLVGAPVVVGMLAPLPTVALASAPALAWVVASCGTEVPVPTDAPALPSAGAEGDGVPPTLA